MKKSTFGDVSVEVADALELIGSLEMTQGLLRQAHRTLTKVKPTPRGHPSWRFAVVTAYKCTLARLQSPEGDVATP